MTHDIGTVDVLVRKRVRGLRLARGWSLQDLASRARISASTLSRIENGRRRLALDQLVDLARALDTSLDVLVETEADDVMIGPVGDPRADGARWPIRHFPDTIAVRRRLTDPPPAEASPLFAHPGHEWLLVLSGVAVLLLGTKRYRIEADHAAEFSTMLPHAIGAEGRPCEILLVVDTAAHRAHDSPAPTDP